MPSSLETETKKLMALLFNRMRGADRAVVVGTALSWIPVFPACTLGFFISLANLYLIKTKRLDDRYFRIITLSIVISALLSVMWAIAIYIVDPSSLISEIIIQVYLHVEHLVLLLLNSIGLNGPSTYEPSIKA
jgi:hypothetical protein